MTRRDAGSALDPQAWLSPHAPPDAIARLAAHGIVTVGRATMAGTTGDLDAEGAQLALRFHLFAALLVAALAVGVLALVGGVDRAPRAGAGGALRVQGIRARTAARAATGGYLVLALAAALVGLGAVPAQFVAHAARLRRRSCPTFTATRRPAARIPGQAPGLPPTISSISP